MIKYVEEQVVGSEQNAQGVDNEDLMKTVYESGADGMTVNFPDKLTELIESDK